MAYLASHGPAAEFGLQRNCDRWGVLERGIIAAPLPVKKNHEVMLRVVEFPVRRTETSHDLVAEKENTGSMMGQSPKLRDDSMSNNRQNGNKGPFYSQATVTGKRPNNTVLTAKSSDGADRKSVV